MTDGRTLTRKTALALAHGRQASLAHLRMQPEFIWHRDAAAIEARLEEALADALAGECEGMDYFLIVGPTGNGKSRLVKKLSDRHARPNDPAASVMSMPVLYTRMSVTGSPVGYVRTVLDKLGAKYSQSNSLDQLYPLLLRLLGRIGVRMLIIDELHHITFGQRDDKNRMMNLIKDVGEQLGCVVVCCGLAEALYAMRYDAQLDRRFEPLPLNRWALNSDYLDLLAAIENSLPLPEPSDLASESLAPWIWAESEGTIKETQRLLRRAASAAIRTDQGRIDLKLLKGLGWTRPSRRRREAETTLKLERMPIVT